LPGRRRADDVLDSAHFETLFRCDIVRLYVFNGGLSTISVLSDEHLLGCV